MPFLGPPSPVPMVHESTVDLPAPPPGGADTVAGGSEGGVALDSKDDAVDVVDEDRESSRRCYRRPPRHSRRHRRYLAVIHPRLMMHKGLLGYPDFDVGRIAAQSGCNVRTMRMKRGQVFVERE